jgi:hypothetical protein
MATKDTTTNEPTIEQVNARADQVGASEMSAEQLQNLIKLNRDQAKAFEDSDPATAKNFHAQADKWQREYDKKIGESLQPAQEWQGKGGTDADLQRDAGNKPIVPPLQPKLVVQELGKVFAEQGAPKAAPKPPGGGGGGVKKGVVPPAPAPQPPGRDAWATVASGFKWAGGILVAVAIGVGVSKILKK